MGFGLEVRSRHRHRVSTNRQLVSDKVALLAAVERDGQIRRLVFNGHFCVGNGGTGWIRNISGKLAVLDLRQRTKRKKEDAQRNRAKTQLRHRVSPRQIVFEKCSGSYCPNDLY